MEASSIDYDNAVADFQRLGIYVGSGTNHEASRYFRMSARSSARWWFIPAQDKQAVRAGLEMFRPESTVGKLARKIFYNAPTLLYLYKKYLTADTVHIQIDDSFIDLVPGLDWAYIALLSGTVGPTRKVCIQLIDEEGVTKGFVKYASQNTAVQSLENESATLSYLGAKPGLLFDYPKLLKVGFGPKKGLFLVTDALQHSTTSSPEILSQAHSRFLFSLSSATQKNQRTVLDFIKYFEEKITANKDCIPPQYAELVDRIFIDLKKVASMKIETSLTHGDFKPGNCRLINDKRLYVFDWEFSSFEYPITNDVIHFIINCKNFLHESNIKNFLSQICTHYEFSEREIMVRLYVYTLSRLTDPVYRHDIRTPGFSALLKLLGSA